MEPLGCRMQGRIRQYQNELYHALASKASVELLGTGNRIATVGLDISQPGKDGG